MVPVWIVIWNDVPVKFVTDVTFLNEATILLVVNWNSGSLQTKVVPLFTNVLRSFCARDALFADVRQAPQARFMLSAAYARVAPSESSATVMRSSFFMGASIIRSRSVEKRVAQ